MSYRTKSAIGLLISMVTLLAVWLVAMWLARTPDGQLHLTDKIVITGIVPGLVIAGIARYAYIRTIRCPNCHVRFGLRNYVRPPFRSPWPQRRCWNCGADMLETERAQRRARSTAA